MIFLTVVTRGLTRRPVRTGLTLVGYFGVKVLVTAPAIRGLLEPDLNPRLLVTAVAIAVVVGIFSGLYPTWRSSRLMPNQALHG